MGGGCYSSKKLGVYQKELGRLGWEGLYGRWEGLKAARKASEAAGSASEAAAGPCKGRRI